MENESIPLIPLITTHTPTIQEYDALAAEGIYRLPYFPRAELLMATINSSGASTEEKASAKRELDNEA